MRRAPGPPLALFLSPQYSFLKGRLKAMTRVSDLTVEELRSMLEEIVETALEEKLQELVELDIALQRLADKEDPILSSEDFRREVLLED